MPTLREHLDAGRGGGGHHGGGHHGGGHHGGVHRRHGGGRGGIVFYDREPDVLVVTDDCPPGYYYDDFGNCRPLPYHSQNVGHFDTHFRPLPKEAGQTMTEAVATPVGWFNPFDPIGSGYSLQTLRDRNALDADILATDARIATAQKQGAKIPAEVIFDYVSFRKDWDAVKGDDITKVQLTSMQIRYRAELDALAPYMKVDDLRLPESPAKTIPKVLDDVSTSIKTVGVAGALAVVAVAIIGAIVIAPHIGPMMKSNAKTAAKLLK